MKKIRNEIFHGKPELTFDKFTAYWNGLTDILIKLGESESEIEDFKENLMKIGDSNVENVKLKFNMLKVIYADRSAAYLMLKDKNS
uniref:Apea-like HEPN domain-containing protein n=1 Tax=Panagrolaimus superbus TaxID=310955 RepID=A0A914XYS9_9BILA